MANIFDYMKWRDIELRKVEFNEIDNLILSRLAYFPFDNIIKKDEEITLKEAYDRYKKMKKSGIILQKEDIDFFPILANSVRFGRIQLSNYVNKIDKIEEKQFSAITVILPDETLYVAYRGTDNTLIGWKEDFKMSFSDTVPAQIDAVKYLNKIAKKYKNKIRVGGHSKGGNLAVYASAFCLKSAKEQIIQVYNNDGPGFNEKITDSQEYKSILNKVHTYIPQTSIIGRLLNHEEKTTILKSTQLGILQHDLYTWQVLGDKFVEDKLTNSSEFIDKTITNWLLEVSPEQRSEFFDTLFEILQVTNAETFSEISTKWFSNAKKMVKTYQKLEPKSKEILNKTLNALFKIIVSNK